MSLPAMNIPDPITDAEDRRAGLSPPRFGLGTLLAGIAVCGILFAFIHYVGPYGSAIAILFLLCVVAHVAGNAMGTRLRDGARSTLSATGDPAKPPRLPVASGAFAPASKLHHRHPLGKPILAVTALGAALTGIGGGLALPWLTGGTPPWQVVTLGVGACAVLGAIWTFAAASFLQVLIGAWSHAAREPRQRSKE